jgi:MerR family copper efflux transcriptional regulator
MSLSITDVARRTGVPTSTLRYYDRLGLLASSGRADNGYRKYDERSLDRLRFIARAKELSCSLEEIASLLGAFDEDCGEVQAPLRAIVDGKIATAQRRVTDLVALMAQLQQARHALTAEAAQGPCRPGCACGDEAPPPAGRPLTMVQLTGSAPDVSCTLGHEQMNDRITDWQAVLTDVRERSPLEGGIRLTLGPDADIAEVARLARDEWACCSFFGFVLTIDGGGTALEVRAPAEAQPLLALVFGVAA